MIYVKAQNLKHGMILASTLFDDNGNILLKPNIKITNYMITRIKNLGFDGVYVFQENESFLNKNLLSEEVRINTIKNLKKLNIDECLYFSNIIVDQILNNSSLLLDEINLSTYDNYLYMHSINVCTISTVIGIGLGLNNKNLNLLAQAALLHDIGKMAIDRDIINKPGKLTDSEYEIVKKHSTYSYNMIKDNSNISSVVKNAIYSHHENEDGTGYPRNLSGDKIHLFAKIIHVADVYDALISKRVYKDSMNPSDVIEYLYSKTGTMFNKKVVETLTKYVCPYPLGTTVELSNGKEALVIKNNPDILSRPLVKTNKEVIDLSKILNITIVNLLNRCT